MNKIISLILLVLLSGNILSQNRDYNKEFENFKSQSIDKYFSFRKEANDEYARHMQNAWNEYFRCPMDSVPEDKIAPIPPIKILDSNVLPILDNKIEIIPAVSPIVVIKDKPEPLEPITIISDHDQIPHKVSFYGTIVEVRTPLKYDLQIKTVSENSISKAWSYFSEGAFDALLSDCIELRTSLHLGDWAYFALLGDVCSSFFGKSTNESKLLWAWLYCQSGYQMRIGIVSNKEIDVLFASEHKIYNWNFYVVNGIKYYSMNSNSNKIRIYDRPYPQERAMSLYMEEVPLLKYEPSANRNFRSEKYPNISFNVSVNKNLIDFYNTYPNSEIGSTFLSRWEIYASTPLSSKTQELVYKPLKTFIKNCTQLEATNRILNWVQTAFQYEYDDKIWGCDRVFFSEETLFYPFCDCEDRSILFSRIIKDLLGIDVAILYYPGHLATAVAFTEQVNGNYVILDGRKFIICDPTYINADVGLTMPNLQDKVARALILH